MAGTMSIQYPLEKVFSELKTPIIRFVPHGYNMRYMRRWVENEKELSKLPSHTYIPGEYWEIQDRIYSAQEDILDDNQAMYTHEWMSFSQFKDPECRHVILMRDPRDIIASYFRRYAKCFPQENPEEILIQLMKGGRYIYWGLGGSCCHLASVKRIIDNYLIALKMPTAYVLRFEGFISNSLSSLKHMLHNLGKYPHPFVNLTDEFLMEAIKLGSYEHQSSGKLFRGIEKNDPVTGKSYRLGLPGGWRSCFTPKAIQVFKELSRDGLIKLGYEKTMEWE